MPDKIIIGTRGSKLALWQAAFLRKILTGLGHLVDIKIIKTRGDRIQDLSFDKIEGKGFFTKELEDALMSEEVDVAVHSMKDLPTSHPEGLVLAGVSARVNPSDILIIKKDAFDSQKLLKLKDSAIVGTSSIRRKFQILDFRKDLVIKDLRGNVPTRIEKLKSGAYDAIILAAAGIERLEIDLEAFETIVFDPREFVPAPAQGVLAYQLRTADTRLRHIFSSFHDFDTAACTNVERKLLELFDGGCHLPLGAYCKKDNNGNFHASAVYFNSGKKHVANISQSTHHGLADLMFNELTKEE